jgi:3-hydroxybutyryl-CoA dehydrogenase
VADFATIDRILRDQVGFKLGPFELMDLTGLDVSHPVMESVYRQYYDEARYRPSVITAQRQAGKVLGRKTGEGFYRYVDGKAQVPPEPPVPAVAEMPPVWVSTRAARRAELYQLLKDLGAKVETGQSPSLHALTLVAPLGFDVTTVAVVERLDPARTSASTCWSRTRDQAARAGDQSRDPRRHARRRPRAVRARRQGGQRDPRLRRLRHAARGGHHRQHRVRHLPAAHLLAAGPGDRGDAGPGLPAGAAGHGQPLGPANILEVLFNMQTVYGDQRYRPSPWLRRRGAIGLSLLQEES